MTYLKDFVLDNILTDKKPYENILVYNISDKSLIDSRCLYIRFNKIDGFIRVYDGTRYLVLFGSEKYDSIYDRIRYLISAKSEITYIISHNYAIIKVDSYDSLPLEKTMTFHNVIILIKVYLCYNTLTSQNVSSEAPIKIFLFCRKVLFISPNIQVFVFSTIP